MAVAAGEVRKAEEAPVADGCWAAADVAQRQAQLVHRPSTASAPLCACWLRGASLVSKRFRRLCFGPELLDSLHVNISGDAVTQRAASLAAFLARHARHIRLLDLAAEEAEAAFDYVEPPQLETEQGEMVGRCLTVCVAAGGPRLERLSVSTCTPQPPSTSWVAQLTRLRELDVGCHQLPLRLHGLLQLTRLTALTLRGKVLTLGRNWIPQAVLRVGPAGEPLLVVELPSLQRTTGGEEHDQQAQVAGWQQQESARLAAAASCRPPGPPRPSQRLCRTAHWPIQERSEEGEEKCGARLDAAAAGAAGMPLAACSAGACGTTLWAAGGGAAKAMWGGEPPPGAQCRASCTSSPCRPGSQPLCSSGRCAC